MTDKDIKLLKSVGIFYKSFNDYSKEQKLFLRYDLGESFASKFTPRWSPEAWYCSTCKKEIAANEQHV